MLIVSDVHGAFEALGQLARSGEPLLILGDLVNYVDYRTMDGIAAEVLGKHFVRQVAGFRATGDYEASRALWREHMTGRETEIRSQIAQHVRRQYEETGRALEGGVSYVTFGNVDRPEALRACLPDGATFVDGDVVRIEGFRVGFVGGGAPTPLGVPGEVSESDMAEKLNGLGPVDILCSHLPPAIAALRTDVITGRAEGSSAAILAYLLEHQPAYHYFGDTHQPQASRWRVEDTRCVNVGYFRATGRAVRHPVSFVSVSAGSLR
jgi:Icc-related predicted phosphoesterase